MSGVSNKLKRKRDESDTNDELIKRRCVTKPQQNFSLSKSKNLANNRLKKLKESIQAELLSNNTKNSAHDLPSTSTTCTEPVSDQEHGKKYLKHFDNIEKEKYTKHDTDIKKSTVNNSPVDGNKEYYNNFAKKNIANERLQRIKKTLQDSETSKSDDKDRYRLFANISSPPQIEDSIQKECSRLKSNEQEVAYSGPKKTLSDIFNSDDDRNSVENKTTSTLHTKLEKNMVNEIKYFNKNNVNIIKEEIDTSKQITEATGPRIKDCDKKDINLEDMNFINYEKVLSDEKKQDSLCKDNVEHTSEAFSLPSKNNNSFSNKMAITASWILNQPQDVSCATLDLSTYSGNSLSVNVDESATTLLYLDDEKMKMDWKNDSSDEEAGASANNTKETEPKLKDLCLVVDTNVFISALQKIKDIMSIKIPGPSEPIILIPWMVMEELDHLKQFSPDAKTKKNAANSIIFISSMLQQKHSRILGQSVNDAGNQIYIGRSPDDKILACCLQAAQKYENVILVSNDVNLKNKAMINNIGACSSHEVIMKIKSTLSGNDKTTKITKKMGDLCSLVICECAKRDYDDAWTKMHMFRNPPWTLIECLHRFERYWSTMFCSRLLKQSRQTVEKLLQHLSDNKVIYDDTEEFVTLVKLCIQFCIYLKDIEDCRASIDKFLNEVKNL